MSELRCRVIVRPISIETHRIEAIPICFPLLASVGFRCALPDLQNFGTDPLAEGGGKGGVARNRGGSEGPRFDRRPPPNPRAGGGE